MTHPPFRRELTIFLTLGYSVLALAQGSNPTTQTFGDVLGRDTVTSVVDKAVAPTSADKVKVTVAPDAKKKLIEYVMATPTSRVKIQQMSKTTASRDLHAGVVVFTNGLKAEVIRSHNSTSKAMLTIEGGDIDAYLSAAKCGQIPCHIPPCCGGCDPCPPVKKPPKKK